MQVVKISTLIQNVFHPDLRAWEVRKSKPTNLEHLYGRRSVILCFSHLQPLLTLDHGYFVPCETLPHPSIGQASSAVHLQWYFPAVPPPTPAGAGSHRNHVAVARHPQAASWSLCPCDAHICGWGEWPGRYLKRKLMEVASGFIDGVHVFNQIAYHIIKLWNNSFFPSFPSFPPGHVFHTFESCRVSSYHLHEPWSPRFPPLLRLRTDQC